MRVLKIGGNELSDSDFVNTLAAVIAKLSADTAEPAIIVHGGGRAIADLQAQLGLETRKVDGLRVTDLESLAVAEMVLSGHSNKIIVKALLAAGLDALGISGVDGGVLRCRKKSHPTADLGYVGEDGAGSHRAAAAVGSAGHHDRALAHIAGPGWPYLQRQCR